MPVPGVYHPDAAAEINEPVPICVGDDGSLRVHHRDRRDDGNAPRNGLRPAGEQGAALGAGDFRPELDDARHLHPEGKGW
jgi:hypothetical protein